MGARFVRIDTERAFELADGVVGRPLFGEGAMLNLIRFEPGATVPLHEHEHLRIEKGHGCREHTSEQVAGPPHEIDRE